MQQLNHKIFSNREISYTDLSIPIIKQANATLREPQSGAGGWTMCGGSIVDVTLISAPSFKKNVSKSRPLSCTRRKRGTSDISA